MPYTRIDHTADLGITVWAPDLPALFTEAAYAMIAIMGAKTTRGEREIALPVEGYDREDLLVRWLEEIRYRITHEGLRIAAITIESLQDRHLEARLQVSLTPTLLKTDIKAVTYHAMTITPVDNHLQTTIIFDT